MNFPLNYMMMQNYPLHPQNLLPPQSMPPVPTPYPSPPEHHHSPPPLPVKYEKYDKYSPPPPSFPENQFLAPQPPAATPQQQQQQQQVILAGNSFPAPSPSPTGIEPDPDPEQTAPASKRPRQRGPPTKHSDTTSRFNIAEDNIRLLELKRDGADWKKIAEVFRKEGRGNLTTNVIRVRFYRLKDKLVIWEDGEVEILKLAIADVERRKWELVSAKMAELGGGSGKKFSAAACERKAKGM